MDVQDAINRKVETATRENESYEREMADLRFKMSVNQGIIEAFKALRAEIEVIPETPPAEQVRTNGHHEYTPPRTVRDTILEFFATNPGVFNMDRVFNIVKAEHPDVTRNNVANFLAYEKQMKRVDHLSLGVYRYPPATISAPDQPTPSLHFQGEDGANATPGTIPSEEAPSDDAGAGGGSDD